MSTLLRRILTPGSALLKGGKLCSRALNTRILNKNELNYTNIFLKNPAYNLPLLEGQKIALNPSDLQCDPIKIKSPVMDVPLRSILPELPSYNIIPKLDLPVVNNVLEDPNSSPVQEKRAARMIIIRRIKMNKHKLKKLYRRNRYDYRKMKIRKKLRKEKHFHFILSSQMKSADRFSPEKFIDRKLSLGKSTIIPLKWRGIRYPKFIIRQLMGLDPKVRYRN